MADFQLKVSTDVMKNKADEVKGQIRTIETNWNRLCDTIERSKSYWEGEASNYHRELLKENREDVQIILKRLKEHPADLLDMAGIYEAAEDQAVTLASELSDEVIF